MLLETGENTQTNNDESYIGKSMHSDSDPPDSGYVGHSTDADPETTAACSSSNDLPVAPDGGWGWVVCFAAFLSMVVLDGMMFSFGVLFLELVNYFNAGKGQTAMVGSALMGTSLLAGPITSALVNACGVRTVAMTGAVLATLASALSILSPNITVLTVLYGFVGGFGVSMVYLPSIIAVGFYFEKHRALANGLTHSGAGVGTFLYSPLTEYLIGEYGWKGTVLILSGCVLNCVVFSALFRPINQHRKGKSRKETVRDGEKSHQDKNEATDQTSGAVVHILLNRDVNGKAPLFSSVPTINVTSLSPPSTPLLMRSKPHKLLPPHLAYDDGSPEGHYFMSSTKSMVTHRLHAQSHSRLPQNTSRDSTTDPVPPWNMKPLYKKDAFYSGSLLRLPEYREGHSNSLYSIPHETRSEYKEDSGVETNREKLTELWAMFRKMTGLSLLLDPTFLITMLSMVMWTTHSTVLTLLPDCALTRGVGRNSAAFLLSIIGASNTAARVLAGWVSDRPEVNCLHVNIVALLIGGASCLMMAFTSSFVLLAIESVFFGLGMGTWTSLRPIILVEMLGLDRLTNAFGLVAMFQGIAFIVGPPIAGSLFERTHSYIIPFTIAGIAFVASALLSIVLLLRSTNACRRTLKRPTAEQTDAQLHIEVT